MFRAFIRDSFFYTLPTIVSRGISFCLIPLYTRVLTPADYGTLDLLTAFISLVNLTVSLEVSQGVARFYTEADSIEKKSAYASTAFYFTLASYFIFCLLVSQFSFELSNFIMGQKDKEKIFQLGVVYIVLNGIFYFVQNQFRWELRSIDFLVTSLIMVVVTAISSIFLTYIFKLGLSGLLLAMILGVFVGLLYGLKRLQGSLPIRFDKNCLKEMLIFSSPLVPSGIAVFVAAYIDRVMINYYLGVEDVGIYSIGFRIASVAGLVIVGFQGALTPLIYTYYKVMDTPVQIERIFRLFVAFVLLAFLGLSLFTKDIIRLITTPLYYEGSVVVIYLVPAILFAQMYIFAPGIGIARKTHLTIWINIAGALLNILLNILFIPVLGIVGAALSTLISYFFVFIIYMWFSQRLYYVPHKWLSIICAGLVSVMLAIGVPALNQGSDQLPNFNNWIVNLCTLVLLGVVMVGLNIIHINEIKKIIRVVIR